MLALQLLFPPHPRAFSQILSLNGSKKYAPVALRSASVAEYLTHLSPDAYDGVGALGMFPGLSVPNERGESRWYAPFFVLDFDSTHAPELSPLIDTLEGYGLYTYPTCGSSGRGSHLYGFVEGLVPQRDVHGVAKLIQNMAKEAGLGLPEIRPSSLVDRGSPIFVSYRGALGDGYGYNPLLDPERDLDPIKLEHTCDVVQRISPEALKAFRVKLTKHRSPKPVVICRSVEQPISHDALTRLRDELKRVSPAFVEPNRQNLVMGITAYAVRGLKVDEATVRREVTNFIKGRDAEELFKRIEALERTLTKYANNPLSVAWKEYYERAGLTPPGKLGTSSEVAAKLERAARTISERAWKGTAGFTDRSVYVGLILVAAEHGTSHERGVAVSVSKRDLALKAGVGDKTLGNSLVRLKKNNIVFRDLQVKRNLTDAGTLVIVDDGVSERPHSFPLLGGLRDWGKLYTHRAFMHGKLGKSAAPLLIALLTEDRPLTRPELAKLLGRASRALRKPLEKLLHHHIVVEVGNALELPTGWEGGARAGSDRYGRTRFAATAEVCSPCRTRGLP